MSETVRPKSIPMRARNEMIRDECRLCIATAAGDRGWDDTRQSWLARAARHLGLSFSRTRKLWYGGARPYADEMDSMRAKQAEFSWQLRRHKERLDDTASQISILARKASVSVEPSTGQPEPAGDAATGHAAVRPKADD